MVSQDRNRRLARRFPLSSLAALLAGIALPAQAFAQAYQRDAPPPLPAGAVPTIAAPPAPASGPASRAPILPSLNGIVFIASPASLRPNGVPRAAAGPQGVNTSDVPLLANPNIQARLAMLVGLPLSFAALTTIRDMVTGWYRAQGHPFVTVTIPPQNIADGVVQLIVSEYRVGAVTVSGNKFFSTKLLKQESGLQPGQTLTLPGLQSDIAALNANPFRAVNLVLAPGAQPATTDVQLRTQDQLPLRVDATYDNQGAPALGRDEWGLGATWGNVAGLDAQLAAQLTRATSGRYTALSTNFTLPLQWRDSLQIFGVYAVEHPNAGAFFDQTGQTGQASLRYVHTLPSLLPAPGIVITQSVAAGYDFKTSNNNLEFGGDSVFFAQTVIEQFPLLYTLSETDPAGQTALSDTIVLSPGHLMGGNSNSAFNTVSPGARPNYVYNNVLLARTENLPYRITWMTRLQGQLASGNLLPSEALALGGVGTVRGYDSDTALGSDGLLASMELRSPPFSFANGYGTGQLGLFLDYGHVSQPRAESQAVNEADLASAGLDVFANFGRYARLAFDIGWRVRSPPGEHGKRGGFADVAIFVGF